MNKIFSKFLSSFLSFFFFWSKLSCFLSISLTYIVLDAGCEEQDINQLHSLLIVK